jgi:hypothetical protein
MEKVVNKKVRKRLVLNISPLKPALRNKGRLDGDKQSFWDQQKQIYSRNAKPKYSTIESVEIKEEPEIIICLDKSSKTMSPTGWISRNKIRKNLDPTKSEFPLK